MSSPTILNNFLWNVVVESDTVFYQGLYSILDKEPKIQKWNTFPKRHELLEGHRQDKSIETLTWFTNGYYNVVPLTIDTLQISDLRFGTLGEEATSPDDFVFRFMLTEENGVLIARQNEDRPPIEDDTFAKFFARIKGK
jgi:inner membrane protein